VPLRGPAKLTCKRCGGRFRETAAGRIYAHDCRHGYVCVPPRGRKADACRFCFEARQLDLFKGDA
jgi:hypothetical protein